MSGYAPNDYITVSGCNSYGAFNEFIVLAPSNHSAVMNNVITQTRGTITSIYCANSHFDTVTGDQITTASTQPIHLVGCSSCTVSGNSLIPLTVPNAPTGLTSIPGNGQVALNWTAPSFNGGA